MLAEEPAGRGGCRLAEQGGVRAGAATRDTSREEEGTQDGLEADRGVQRLDVCNLGVVRGVVRVVLCPVEDAVDVRCPSRGATASRVG